MSTKEENTTLVGISIYARAKYNRGNTNENRNENLGKHTH